MVQRGSAVVVDMTAAAERNVGDPVRCAAVAVRLVDFMCRAGLLDLDADMPGADQAHRLLEIALPPVAMHPVQGRELVAAVGSVSGAVLRDLLRPILSTHVMGSSEPPGERAPAALLAWLYPEPPAPPTANALARDGGVDPLIAEIAAQSMAIVPDPSAFRLAALWAELTTPAASADRIAFLAAGPPLPPAAIASVVAAFGPLPVLPFLMPTLLSGRADEIGVLTEELLLPAHGLREAAANSIRADQVRTAVDLWRGLGWWQTRENERPGALALAQIERGQRLLLVDQRLQFGRDLWTSLAVAHVVDVIRRPLPERPRVELERQILGVGSNGGTPVEACSMLVATLESGMINDEDVLVAALHGVGDPLPGPAAERQHLLSKLTLPGGRGPLLNAVLTTRKRAGRSLSAELRERARRRIHDEIHAAVPARHEAARLFADHDAAAERWWKAFDPAPLRRPIDVERRPRASLTDILGRERGIAP
jgi:hypothetical protein